MHWSDWSNVATIGVQTYHADRRHKAEKLKHHEDTNSIVQHIWIAYGQSDWYTCSGLPK